MILVTGGTGLLGSHVLMRLLADGAHVRAIYRTEKKRDAVKRFFAYYNPNADELWQQIEWVQGDVLDVPSLEDAMVGVRQVYHCAAAVTFIPKEEPYMHKVNTEGTANVVNICLEVGGVRLCHVSSVAAIGRDGSEQIISEKNEWKDSKHNAAYAISKHNAELEVWRGVIEGLDAFMVNPTLIIGPGDWEQSTGVLFQKTWKGLPFYTRGGNCFVDARDVAEVMVRMMASDVRNDRFIVGAENRLHREVFERLAANMNKKPPQFEAKPWMTEIVWRVEKLRSAISGAKPFITKEVAHHALQLNRYDNAKLLAQLPDFAFRDMNDSFAFVCEQYVKDKEGAATG
ncbi:MAG: NAD-dependent epimerase/dehydratase family protein [Flavobacteriales bacterium]|nr:NAD-dependent epimerase/dehydratase family protein [Flavobacteriales bacterium]